MTATFGALCALCAPGTASGQALVVKARATVTELLVQARGLTVSVEGNLRDNLGQPVPGEALEVILPGGAPVPARTDTEGHFEVTARANSAGNARLRVHFPGGALLGAAEAAADVTFGRTAVALTLEAPEQVEVRKGFDVSVHAADAHGAPLPGVPVAVSLDGHVLATARTDRQGGLQLEAGGLPRGAHALRADFTGDADQVEARAEGTVVATSPLAVTLGELVPKLPPDGTLEVQGHVIGAEGDSVPVLLTANGQAVGGSSSNAEGDFRLAVPADALGAGRIKVRVMANPTDPGLRGAASAEKVVEVEAPPPPSLTWMLAPTALAALAAAGAIWRRRPTLGPQVTPPARPTPPPPFVHRPSEATGDGALHLEIRSAQTGVPLAGVARLLTADDATPARFHAPTGALEAAQPTGTLRLTGPADRLWVSAPGYRPDVHRCLVPPGGHVVVHLQTLRVSAQALHEEVLAAAGRPVLRFGRETPAQAAVDLLARGAPLPAVTDLTEAVERACFAADAPTLDDLVALDVLAAGVRAHFARRRSP